MKYAAIIRSSVFVTGDERSRTNPGHGYPEHHVDTITFKEFKSKEDMERWVEQKETQKYGTKEDYRLIRYEELQVEVKTTIVVKETK